MKKGGLFFLFLVLVLWSSCRSDFDTVEASGNLEFSRDTVFLDTVFSNLSTATYSFKVYNRTGEDIHIPAISLENGENSLYRLNVDGRAGNSFENVEILARDSIYIFIETTVPSEALEENEFLYVDKLQFLSRAHVQKVPLITLVKDAVLLFPQKNAEGIPERIPVDIDSDGEPELINGFYLPQEHLSFNREKPYVIYGYATVPAGEVLQVDPGARVFFHSDSGILVPADASIRAKGGVSMDSLKVENQIIFQGDRLQGLYRNIPGQWGGIWLQKASKNSHFEHVTIRNAGVGVFAEGTTDSPTPLSLKNVQIYNSAVSGIRAINAEISAENLVINNSGQTSLFLEGGSHLFRHTSIGNYWEQSFRIEPAVYISNIGETGPAPVDVAFFNTIIFGNEARELVFNIDESYPAEILFSHTLLKYRETETPAGWYDFSNEEIYRNVWLNEDPLFVAPKKNDLQLLVNSAAIDKADKEVAQEVPQDITGTDRTANPDLGAYEFVEIQQ